MKSTRQVGLLWGLVLPHSVQLASLSLFAPAPAFRPSLREGERRDDSCFACVRLFWGVLGTEANAFHLPLLWARLLSYYCRPWVPVKVKVGSNGSADCLSLHSRGSVFLLCQLAFPQEMDYPVLLWGQVHTNCLCPTCLDYLLRYKAVDKGAGLGSRTDLLHKQKSCLTPALSSNSACPSFKVPLKSPVTSTSFSYTRHLQARHCATGPASPLEDRVIHMTAVNHARLATSLSPWCVWLCLGGRCGARLALQPCLLS